MVSVPEHPPVSEHATVDAGVRALVAGATAGAVVVHHQPVGAVPPTPTEMHVPDENSVSARTLLDAAGRLGTPVGYLQEHGGHVVQNVYPLAGSIGAQVSTSSDVQLAFHTETAFHPHKSRYLLLHCLRGDPDAATTLCSWDAIEPHLAPSTREVLAESRFRIGVDLSFGGDDGWLSAPAPVAAHRPDGNTTFTYDGELSVGTDPRARAALAELGDVIAAVHTSVVLTQGDLLMVDNHRAVHGRSVFRARFDGTDRWLQRTFVLDSLVGITDRRGSVITTAFRAGDGGAGAGRDRDGMSDHRPT